MTTEHLKSAIGEAVGPLRTELKWQRYIVGALATAAFGPKLSQLPPIALILEPGNAQSMFMVARAYIGL